MARELKDVPTEGLLLRVAKSDDPEEFGEAVGELIRSTLDLADNEGACRQ